MRYVRLWAAVEVIALVVPFAPQVSIGSAASARALYLRAMERLYLLNRFEMDAVVHFTLSPPQYRFHYRVRFIRPDRLEVERPDRLEVKRNDHPSVSIQVGRDECIGTRLWQCQRTPTGPDVRQILDELFVPRYLTHVRYAIESVGLLPASAVPTVTVVITAHGDPYMCPPYALTCPLFGPHADIRRVQDASRYTARIVVDKASGLPLSLSSSETRPKAERLPANDRVSPAQQVTFSYRSRLSVELPRYQKWKCPWWDLPDMWCMEEPGA